MEEFSNNLVRLLGLHRLSAKEAAAMMGISESSFTKWVTGRVTPSFTTALTVGLFFDVPADRLANAPFENLLENELASIPRFRDVEREKQLRRTRLEEISKLPVNEQRFGRGSRAAVEMNKMNEELRARRAARIEGG